MFTKAQALAVTQLLAVMFAKLPVQEDYYDIPELSDYYDFIIGMYGVDGEMILSSPASNTPLARAFLNAGKELGYDIVDYNAGDMIGPPFRVAMNAMA
ncbi:hypothetical protein V5799_033270 [Amblyomma americanum]|uniref:Uncharacterized protein n=1 Tax=Amblyomma americanum TaxID=6943 RepID=A0AAQ4DNT2_AMBAM